MQMSVTNQYKETNAVLVAIVRIQQLHGYIHFMKNTWFDMNLNAKGHLDELQKAEIVGKSKLVPYVFIKTHNWINQR